MKSFPPPKKKIPYQHFKQLPNQPSHCVIADSLCFLSLSFKKYIFALSLKSSLLLFCCQQLHVVSYISFLINNIIPNWWPHHLSLAWDRKRKKAAITDSWLERLPAFMKVLHGFGLFMQQSIEVWIWAWIVTSNIFFTDLDKVSRQRLPFR